MSLPSEVLSQWGSNAPFWKRKHLDLSRAARRRCLRRSDSLCLVRASRDKIMLEVAEVRRIRVRAHFRHDCLSGGRLVDTGRVPFGRVRC